MLNSFSILTPNSIAPTPLMDVCDKPFGLGFNFMGKVYTHQYKQTSVDSPCNKCGLNPKYPSQGLCKKCFFEKQNKKWVESRPPKIPIPDLPNELWVDIAGAEGYQISNMGRVKSLNKYDEAGRHHLLRLREATKGGYYKADLDKYNWRPSVHRLVAAAFLGKSDLDVNHIDFDRANNRLENLEYCTRKENTAHSKRAGRLFSGNEIFDDISRLTVYTFVMSNNKRKLNSYLGASSTCINSVAIGKSDSCLFNLIQPYKKGFIPFRYKIKKSDIPDILNRIKNGETQKSVGASYGVTKERISQIFCENKASSNL